MTTTAPIPSGGWEHKHFMIWRERDGTPTPIPNMRTSHIEFCIDKINRTQMKNGTRWRAVYLPFLEEELSYRQRLDNNRKTT